MMGTVSLELTNFINPELTWKKVAKGNRSASRRSRKPASKNSKMCADQADKGPRKTENTSVSESEKLGVAVLGRRFSEKVEHVPIKKRRFLFRSPSPPPRTPSPSHEDSDQLVDSQRSSSQQSSSSNSISKQQIVASHSSKSIHSVDVVVGGRISEGMDGESVDGEDFSGIEMLAAAACNNSMGDDVKESTSDGGPIFTSGGNDSSTSAVPMKDTVASSGTADTIQKDMVVEDDFEGSLSQNGMQNLHSDKDDVTLKKSASLRDDRLHWDLNVVMDAWEEPTDCQILDSMKNAAISEDGNQQSEKLEILEDCHTTNSGGTVSGMENTAKSVTDNVVLVDVQGDMNMVSDARVNGLITCESNTAEHKLEACSTDDTTCSHEKGIPTATEHALGLSIVTVSDAEASKEVVMDACFMQSASPHSHHIRSTQISDENRDTEINSITVDQSREESISNTQLDEPVCIRSDMIEKNEIAFSSPPVTKTNCEIECLTNNGDDDSTHASSGEMMKTDICSRGQEQVEVPTNEGEVHFSHSPIGGDDLSASVTSVIEAEAGVTVGVKDRIDQVSAADATTVDPLLCVGSNECGNKSSLHNITTSGEQLELISDEVGKNCDDDPANCSGKVDLEDAFDESYDTDVSQDDRRHPVGIQEGPELDVGYESQFEDGELREPVVRPWEENEAEDGEAERVDYESDNRDMYDFDAVDYPGPVTVEVEAGSECQKERLVGSNHFVCQVDETTIDNGLKETSVKPRLGCSLEKEAEFSSAGFLRTSKPHSWMQLTRKVDTNIRRGFSAGSKDVAEEAEQLAGEGALKEQIQINITQGDQLPHDREISADKNAEVNDGRVIGPRTKRELLSRIEGPSSYDAARKDSVLMQRRRSNNLGDSDPRAERGTDSDKSIGRSRSALHIHGRGQRDGNWDEPSTGYWDSKHRGSPSYNGPYGSGRPRPRSIVETGGFVMTSDRTISKPGVGGLDGIHRQSVSSSSKGVYRPLIRRRSPSDRDDPYGMHMGMAPGRDVSPGRSRGRSRRYQGVNRGPRDSYHASIPDETAEFPLRMSHHLPRRERSISPVFSRGAPHFSESHKISRSRSRSRSPPAWLMSRERNASSRQFSRSPDFRSGARMERVRLPFQKPNFAVDFEGFVSPPRGRISPQHNSRWIDDRNGAIDHFRDGRSPVRMFQQSQRFDSMGPPRRLKSNDYYRPMVHPGRLPEMVGAGRGRKHDDSDDDRRKHGDRYEMIRPVRRYDTGGVVKRFRYDTEDCVLSRNPHNSDDCIRGAERRSRDIPRRASEEKRHLRFNHERLYNSSPNSFGMREYDEDASPRRGRPA